MSDHDIGEPMIRIGLVEDFMRYLGEKKGLFSAAPDGDCRIFPDCFYDFQDGDQYAGESPGMYDPVLLLPVFLSLGVMKFCFQVCVGMRPGRLSISSISS